MTDGHKEVQARKVAALGLAGRVRHAYLTNRYGRHRAKPDPHVFQLICQREGVAPTEVTYVGDKIKFQNGFGAWVLSVYECDYNIPARIVLDVRAAAGRVPD